MDKTFLVSLLKMLQEHMIVFKNVKHVTENITQLQVIDADPKVIQQITFTENLDRNSIANTTLLFIIEEAKETTFDFLQGTVRVL